MGKKVISDILLIQKVEKKTAIKWSQNLRKNPLWRMVLKQRAARQWKKGKGKDKERIKTYANNVTRREQR